MPNLAWLAMAMVLLGGPSPAGAAPPRYTRPAPAGPVDPALVPAESAWAAAVAERDPRLAAELWRAAARAFTAVAAATAHDRGVRATAAAAAVLAWKNALAIDPVVRAPGPSDDGDRDAVLAPRPLTPDQAGLVETIGLALALGAAPADEVAQLRFLRGNVLRRANRFDDAALDFEFVLAHDPAGELAEYAANLLLDGLNRTQRYDQLVARARALRADPALVRAHPELAAVLTSIERQWQRKQAEQAEHEARASGDLDAFARCADIYDQLGAQAPRADDADVVLYNAGICAAAAGDGDGALARFDQLLRDLPRTSLATRALAQRAGLAQRIGRIALAADAWSRYARAYTGERDAIDRMTDAVAMHLATGDRDRAARDAGWLVTTAGPRSRADVGRAVIAVTAARLEHGERAAARRLAADALRWWRPGAAELDLAFAALVWDAACPVAPIDGLCRPPRRAGRDRALARFALDVLRRSADALGQVLIADAALEAVLAVPTPATARRGEAWRARVMAAAATARAAYQRVLDQPDAGADPIIRAHAGLGRLALHRHDLHLADPGDPVDPLTAARAAFAACAARVAADQRPSLHHLCERGLAEAGRPPPSLDELRPAPTPTSVAPEPEP